MTDSTFAQDANQTRENAAVFAYPLGEARIRGVLPRSGPLPWHAQKETVGFETSQPTGASLNT